MKKIILLSLLVVATVVCFGKPVYAASSTFSILPSTGSIDFGTMFNVAVQINPQGNKTCVVMGTLSFDNLTCVSVAVAPGFMAQTTPTCSKPSFVLGIPRCTTAVKNMFSFSVKGNNVGQATVSFTGVRAIGVGKVVASAVSGGAYSIVAVPTSAPTPAPKPVPQSAGAASLLTLVSNVFNPSVIAVILLLLVILIILWAVYKRKSKQK